MNLYNQLFPLPNSWLLITALLLAVISIFLSRQNKHTAAIFLLLITALVLRLFTAHLDSFLNKWDEQFHALVARNMMHDPLKPMLRASNLLPSDYKEWCCNHIWLHKQPLFLWQMALSMKIFGVSEYAVRYPAVLMGSIGVMLVYRISFLMTGNKHISFIAALLTCFSYYQLSLLSGHEGMDQNDCAFDFYVLCSIWAYAEYSTKKLLKYALLIGFFAGCAILNKWLTGLLVFSAWGIVLLTNIGKPGGKKDIIHYLLALTVCTAVFLPWQLYIFHVFPVEAKYEFDFNSKHLLNVVEGHSGTNWYYLDFFSEYFGQYLYFFLYAGLLIGALHKKYRNTLSASALIFFILTFSFFSFAAATKVYAYMAVVIPIGYIFIAIALYELQVILKRQEYLYIPFAVIAALLALNLPELTSTHDLRNSATFTNKKYNADIYKNFREMVPVKVKVVLNVRNYVDFMFYNNNTDAYSWVPSADDIAKFKKMHYPIAVFIDPGANVPVELDGYEPLYVIPIHLK